MIICDWVVNKRLNIKLALLNGLKYDDAMGIHLFFRLKVTLVCIESNGSRF